jgi:hypothetical protein
MVGSGKENSTIRRSSVSALPNPDKNALGKVLGVDLMYSRQARLIAASSPWNSV